MKTTSWLRTGSLLVLSVLPVARSGAAGDQAGSPPTKKAQFRVDARKSRFIVETETSGLSTMFGHDHKIEIGDFGGMARFAPGALATGALEMTVRADSLRLLEEKNVGERQAIESALREDVLETSKYPEITFKTRATSSGRRGDGTYDVRLIGELRLHGVRKQVTVPARVSFEGGALHAIGTFEIKQTDFNITPFSFVSGTVTIKDTVVLSFDIIADPL
ncbi:MAG TPA: YceI family protein [Polyangia bacterium]|jgi:polyisoprenoid-binding protein YceI